MTRWQKIGRWGLLLTGTGFLLACGMFALVIPSAALKESRPLLATFGMLTLFCFPTGVIGFYLIEWAEKRRLRNTADSIGLALSQKAARALVALWMAVALIDLCRATTPKIYVPSILVALWLGGSFYYLRFLGGWSRMPTRVRQRFIDTIGAWVYGLCYAMAWVLVNAVWLLLTAGRGGLVHFGGGRSGGAGASSKW
jgi:hypothetical protein